MTTYFVIKHKPTGQFMPESRGGYSWWTPGYSRFQTPRLFASERAAKNALTCWLQGHWSNVRGHEGDWESGYVDVDEPPAPVTSVPGRLRDDMEVVQVQLV